MADEVKLYGNWVSPFSRRVELALMIKGIKYEFIEEDLSNKSPCLLKYNPIYKKVPVLVHNGKPIAESLVILDYIEETWPQNPLLPEDPYDRARARFWARFVDDKEEREKAAEEVFESMKLLEKELEGKEYFGGKCMGYLDVVVFSRGYWCVTEEDIINIEMANDENFPLLCAWFWKLFGIKAVRDCILSERNTHMHPFHHS